MSGAIGIQSTGAIVLSASELTDDMVLIQVVTVGAPLTGVTLGALKAYVNGGSTADFVEWDDGTIVSWDNVFVEWG